MTVTQKDFITGEPRYRVCLDRTVKEFENKFGFPTGLDEFDKRYALQKVVRSDIKYAFGTRKRFSITRYGNGTWPVLYAAADIETGIHEVAYHLRTSWKADAKGNRRKRYRLSKRVAYVLGFDESSFVTVPSQAKYLDSKKYSDCHDFAKKALSKKAKGLKAPSVRKKGGLCYPVFDKDLVETHPGLEKSFTIRWETGPDELMHTANGQLKKFVLWRR